MTEQHARISLDEAKWLYREKIINSTTLVLVYFRSKLASDWIGKFTNREIYEYLGLSEKTFYRAIAELRVKGLLFWKNKGVTEYALRPDTLYKEKTSRPLPSRASGGTTVKVDRELSELTVETVKVDRKDCHVGQSELSELTVETVKVDRKQPLEPIQGKDFGSSPSLYQLYFNSLSSLFQETGEGERELIDFFEWMDEHLWPTFDTPVNHPDRWLKSIDPETTQPRFWTQWAAYQFHQKIQERRKNGAICRNYEAEWQKVLGLSATMSYGQTSDTLIKDPLILEAVKFVGGLYVIGTADFSANPKHKAAFISKLKELDENATLSSFLPENSEV